MLKGCSHASSFLVSHAVQITTRAMAKSYLYTKINACGVDG
jgi:hypothetical protein